MLIGVALCPTRPPPPLPLLVLPLLRLRSLSQRPTVPHMLQAVVNTISLRHQQEQAADERRHVYG